ncbi:MAG TPA: HNH endonuclease [Candidatus Limnocylindrales bacterium]
MHRQAEAIRAAITEMVGSGGTASAPADLDLEDDGATEGGLLERLHLRRERDRGIRERAVHAFRKRHGRIVCEACGFDFAATYGPRGEDYIECHHKVPLSQSGVTITRIRDFALLCSNCHRMIHRRRPWLSFDELVGLITAARHGG